MRSQSLCMEQPFPIEQLTHPAEGEKLTVPTLIVGDTLAAYTATLAALRGGDQVCWVTTATPGQIAGIYTPTLQAPTSSLLARRGSRYRLPGTHFAISLSQRQWRERAYGLSESPSVPTQSPPAASGADEEDFLTGKIAAYLQDQQLTIIPHARPLVVIYKDTREQRQITQVLFQSLKTRHRFSVQADITIEATHKGDLAKQVLVRLSSASAEPNGLPPALLSLQRQARSYSFVDSVGIVQGSGRLRSQSVSDSANLSQTNPLPPVTLPARALVQAHLQGIIFSGQNLRWENAVAQADPKAIAALLASPAAEWAVGEASGHLAAFAHSKELSPHAVISDPNLRLFQTTLLRYGIPLFWFDDIAQDDPDFEAIQTLAVVDVMRTTSRRDLHFRPEVLVSRAVLTAALIRLMAVIHPDKAYAPVADPATLRDVPLQHWAYNAIHAAVSQGWVLPLRRDRFLPSRVINHRQLYTLLERIVPEGLEQVYQTTPINDRPVKRRDLARLLYGIFCMRLGIQP